MKQCQTEQNRTPLIVSPWVLLSLIVVCVVPPPALYAQEPISETPCAMSCRIPGLPAQICGADIHAWHDGLNMCSNYGEVELPEGGTTMVVGHGNCNISWQDGTRFGMTCAYGNCEGSGRMRCGGVLYEVNLSCGGGPRGDQSDVARMDFGHDLAQCIGWGNGMRAQCDNGTYRFAIW